MTQFTGKKDIMEIPKTVIDKLINNVADGVYLVDTNRVITYWNKAAEQITGFRAMDVLGSSCADNILCHVDDEGNNLCINGCPLYKTLQDGEIRNVKVYLHHKNGHRVPINICVIPIKNDHGKIIGCVEIFSDKSNKDIYKQKIRELEQIALLDHLTHLANRHYLQRELDSRLNEFNREKTPFGLLMLDIDHFKKFNDTYGHDVGDDILQCIAKTLSNNARLFDLFGRWGGEEFVGIIRNITLDSLNIIAERIRSLIRTSYIMVEGEKVNVTVSIGATLIREADDIKTLIKRADDLLYTSKKNGRNKVSCE